MAEIEIEKKNSPERKVETVSLMFQPLSGSQPCHSNQSSYLMDDEIPVGVIWTDRIEGGSGV